MFSLINQLFSDPLGFLTMTLYRVPAILFALILHEWAHGYVAYRLGDPTAKMMGRLSLNPARHLDPLGTFFLLFFGFGWAKPVPVNPNNFKKPRRDDFLVSIAGITMNLLLYLLFTTVYFLYGRYLDNNWVSIVMAGQVWQTLADVLWNILQWILLINLSLAIFNLLPIPPLDGYHVLNDLVLHGRLYATRQASQIGMAVLLIASFTGILGDVLGFVRNGILDGTFWVLERIFGA